MFGGLVFGGGPFGGYVTWTGDPLDLTAGITIGGVDVRRRIRRNSVTIHDILNDAPNTCALVMEGDGPAVGQDLRVTINRGAVVLFAGQIQAVDQTFDLQPDQVCWKVAAIDDTARANYYRPFGAYENVSATAIAQNLTAAYAPGFSTAGIQAGLEAVTINFDGTDTFIAALTRLATAVGGYCKVEDRTVYLFTVDPGPPPDPIDPAHCFMLDPKIRANVDSSQLRTRVYGKGYGESVQADVVPGETLVPITLGVNFPPFGSEVMAGITADGAQTQKFSYTGVSLRGAGTLVGPGAAPAGAPTLALAAGGVVTSGVHVLSVVHVTATGRSLEGPLGTIDVNPLGPPGTALTASPAQNGTGPDQGSHDYVVTFAAVGGETVAGPVSNAVTTSAAQGQVAAPGAPNADPRKIPGALPSTTSYDYRVTFVTAMGETDGGAPSNLAPGPGVPIESPHALALLATTGGGLTPNTNYSYYYSYVCANGFETAIGGNSSQNFVNASQNAMIVRQQVLNPWGDERPIKYRIYRNKATGGTPGGAYLVAERPLDFSEYLDTKADAALTEFYAFAGQGGNSGPRGPDPGYQVHLTGIATGPAGVTVRKIYRRTNAVGAYHFLATVSNNTTTNYQDNIANNDQNADIPPSNTTGTAVQQIPLSAIPLGPAGTTGRKLYRRFNGAGLFKLVTTLANNAATTYTDAVPNSALGASPPTSSTAVGNQIALTAIPVGAPQVTGREIYMSAAGGGTRYRALVIANNTDTTATVNVADPTLVTQPVAPATDTSGLQQPQGQVNPGATAIPVATVGPFPPTGGWVELGGGQVVRYTGTATGQLTGVPATGPGAITTTVLYGSQAIPAPMLTGASARTLVLKKGSPLHIWVQRDDLQAQAEQRARAGGDGIIEYVLVDTRRGLASLSDRCDAELQMFSRPLVTVAYATRDLKTKSGKQVTVNLASPAIHETLTIQDVTITELELAANVAPRFTVQASSVRFSLEDTLRRLISGGLVAGGST